MRNAQPDCLNRGARSLKFDLVAQEAGISKDGLLHYFPSKDALIEGMIQFLLDSFSAELERERVLEEEGDRSGNWLRAYLRANVSPEISAVDAIDISGGLLGAVFTNPTLLAPAVDRFKEWQENAEHDGLYVSQILQIDTLDKDLEAQVIARLIQMT